jgi:hypothetical protein
MEEIKLKLDHICHRYILSPGSMNCSIFGVKSANGSRECHVDRGE